ncbi:MAG: biopolymer transporter ExbD [Bacteroidota bacterium]
MVIPRKARPRNSSVINAGSMADIAFLLLIFFLVTTEIVEEKGLAVVLPAYDDVSIVTPYPKDQTLTIVVNYENDLLVEDEEMDFSELRQRVYDHITTKGWEPIGPIVSFRPDRSTNYSTYLTAYNEILAAYGQLRDEQALERYAMAFDELDLERKRVIAKEVPIYLSEAEMTDLGR